MIGGKEQETSAVIYVYEVPTERDTAAGFRLQMKHSSAFTD